MTQAGHMEAVLARSVANRTTPYRWLSRAVASSAELVVDVACGAGAMTRELHRPSRVVIGVDWSAEELALAGARDPGPWVQADARALPFRDASVDAVTTSMGLAVIEPAEELVAEAARVLKPGGVFAALVPTVGPASAAEVLLATQLSWALKTMLRFPGTLMTGFGAMLGAAGLTKVEDQRERYRYPVRSRADAETLLAAIDLDGVPRGRVDDAIALLGERTVASGEVQVAVPMRRIVAIK